MPAANQEIAADSPAHKSEVQRAEPGLIARQSSLPGVFLMTESFHIGGSERQFTVLARSIDPALFRLHLGCIRQEGPFLDGLTDLEEFRLGGSLYGQRSIRARLRLAQHVQKCEITIAHAFDFYTNLTLIPAARLAGVPVVIGSQRQLGDLLTSTQSLAQLAAFHFCDAVICNSKAAADRLIDAGLARRKVHVIYNGLPPSAFAPAQPALPRSDLLRVGMIARMNARYKGHDTFLRAVARLHARFPQLEVLLIGDGPLREGLERETEKFGIRDQVQFLGNRPDIAALLASLDISVVPSSSESLSNVILESMAGGVPVVATRVGGNAELLEGRGSLVPYGDDRALAEALDRLLRDPALRGELAIKARRFAEQNFSTSRMALHHQQLYGELLARTNWQPKTISTSRASRRLRVALVAPSLHYVGGQAVQAELLLRHWQHDREIDVGFVPVDPPFPPGLRWAARIPVLRTMVREPLYIRNLWRELGGIDIAHVFSASYWSFFLAPVPALLIARMRGKKVIINYRSGEARDHLKRFRSALPLMRCADRIVVPSGHLVAVFREFGLEAQIVPNIVDLAQFRYRARIPLRPHLICTRGFRPYYCIDVVVRALAEVQKEFLQASLHLVGEGPLEGQIRQLVRELGLRNVNFSGVVSRQEIGRVYDEADLFINASRLDNMPISVLEAFASGTPVITTAPEGMSYLVEHERTGMLSEPGDAAALAANVIRVLRDQELAGQLAANAHKESSRYHWQAVREQWLDLYRSLS